MRRWTLVVYAAVAVIVTAAGVAWEIAALNWFAKQAGEMRGMVSNPRPLDYVNYDYTPHGKDIAFWAFTLPTTVTGLALLVVGVIGTLVFVRSGVPKRAFALWGCIIVCAVVIFAVTARYYLIATNFFI